MSEWRPARTLAVRCCDDCAHAWTHTTANAAHRLCKAPNVLAAMKRKFVAASIAWDEACAGKHWRVAK